MISTSINKIAPRRMSSRGSRRSATASSACPARLTDARTVRDVFAEMAERPRLAFAAGFVGAPVRRCSQACQLEGLSGGIGLAARYGRRNTGARRWLTHDLSKAIAEEPDDDDGNRAEAGQVSG